jgi:hypothetical protein
VPAEVAVHAVHVMSLSEMMKCLIRWYVETTRTGAGPHHGILTAWKGGTFG